MQDNTWQTILSCNHCGERLLAQREGSDGVVLRNRIIEVRDGKTFAKCSNKLCKAWNEVPFLLCLSPLVKTRLIADFKAIKKVLTEKPDK